MIATLEIMHPIMVVIGTQTSVSKLPKSQIQELLDIVEHQNKLEHKNAKHIRKCVRLINAGIANN